MKRYFSPSLLSHLMLKLFLFFSSVTAFSQIGNFNGLPQFLCPEFTASKVKMKAGGKDINLLLNYNMVTQKMVFFQKDQVYDLLNDELVDTIYMSGSRFVKIDKAFFEAFPGNPLTFFIQHVGKIMAPAKPAAYGGTSELSSSTYISRINLDGGEVYNSRLEGDLRVKYDPVFWVKINGQLNDFTSEKQYLKLFPGKEELIKQYIKKNKVKFDRQDQLVKLWSYTNSIMK